MKQGEPWPVWNLEDEVEDPNQPGKVLWVPNFRRGVDDSTNIRLLKQVSVIVLQALNVCAVFLIHI